MAQAVYYFTAAVALGAPYRKVAFTVPTGNFGDVYAGYVAQRLGLPIDRLVIATNVNDILARTLATGTYELRDVVATTSPSMDIQVSSNFERLLFDAYGRDGSGRARADGVAGAVAAASRLSARALSQIRALFAADRADEDEVAATIRARHARDRQFHRSAHRGRPRRRREGNARPGGADGGAVDRASRPSFPMRSRRPAACGRRCRSGFPISTNVRSASPCCRRISPRSSVSS